MKLSVRTKLLVSSGALLFAALLIAIVAIASLGSVSDQARLAYSQGTTAVKALGTIDTDLAEEQGALNESVFVGHVSETQSEIDATVAADEQEIDAALAVYEGLPRSAQESSDLAAFKAERAKYESAFASARSDARLGSALATAAADAISAGAILSQAVESLDRLEESASADAAAIDAQTQTTFDQGRLIVIVIFLIQSAVGVGLAVFVSGSIRRGVRAVQATLTSMTDNCATDLEAALGALARNDLTVEAHATTSPIERYGGDEIGETAAVTNRMLAKLKSTMESYETARRGLADTVTEVKTAAEALASASDQLNAAATQSGVASAQVAQTIGQVAVGAGDQARAASQTSAASQDLTRIIERVREGRRQHADARPGCLARARRHDSGRQQGHEGVRRNRAPERSRERRRGRRPGGRRRDGRRNEPHQDHGRIDRGRRGPARRQVRPDRGDRRDDRRHRRADQPARAQRGHRGGPSRRAGQGLRRRRRRGPQARRALQRVPPRRSRP